MNSQGIADFRSDTVTHPSRGMRAAMAAAPVGDDVMGEDPTVNALQERVARLTGKEAALFISSGTMGNLLATLSHTKPGDEIIVHSQCHIVGHELAGCARIGGVMSRTVDGLWGVMPIERVEAMLRDEELHEPRTAMVAVENTHNDAGGCPLPMEHLKAMSGMLRARGVPLHMDGARLLNAACVLNVSVGEIAAYADSVTLCLSKGLGAPVGSVLAGSNGFIERARRFRKMLGGGMRQAGIMAAAGLYALDNNVDRLRVDHDNAAYLADALNRLPGVSVEDVPVRTNLVYLSIEDREAVKRLEELARDAGIALWCDSRMRVAAHMDVDRSDCQRLVGLFAQALRYHMGDVIL